MLIVTVIVKNTRHFALNGITLGPGTLYIGLPGEELVPISEVKETKLIEAIENKDAVEIRNIIRAPNEASFTVDLTKQVVEKFLMMITKVDQYILDIIREEGHKKVCHLSRHAKKHRTRKKNFNRARRILVKEVK